MTVRHNCRNEITFLELVTKYNKFDNITVNFIILCAGAFFQIALSKSSTRKQFVLFVVGVLLYKLPTSVQNENCLDFYFYFWKKIMTYFVENSIN